MATIELPDDIVFPIPENSKEEDLYNALQDYLKLNKQSIESMNDLVNVTAGDGLTDTSNTLSVNVDDVTIELNGDKDLTVKAVSGDLLNSLADIPSGAGVIPAANLPTARNIHTISTSDASGAATDGDIWLKYIA